MTGMTEPAPKRRRLRTLDPARRLGRFILLKRWFFIAILVALVISLLPTPEGLTRNGHLLIAITAAAVIMFVTEPIPLPAVALMIVVSQILWLGNDSDEVAQSLMSDSVLFIMGSLMLAVAIVKQKLDKRIAFFIVQLTGTRTFYVAMGITAMCGLLSSVIGEHTVAAMMLPVALTLVQLTAEDGKDVKGLAAVLLFSIAFGCAIGGVGTPSGGARNAILINYYKEFFYDPADPSTSKYLIGYLDWMKYAYPMFVLQLPLVTGILFAAFRPKQKRITRAIARLRRQIEDQGQMNERDWTSIFVFVTTLAGWIFLSDTVGLGTIAIFGAIAYLFLGLVQWSDINSGVNWGVVLLYAAAISLGTAMQASGTAQWLADTYINAVAPYGLANGLPLIIGVMLLTTLVTNTMSAGATVAVLAPIVLTAADQTGTSPIALGFVMALASSFAYFTAAAHPAFTIVYSSGHVKANDFLKAGWRMALMSGTVLMFIALAYWPLLGV